MKVHLSRLACDMGLLASHRHRSSILPAPVSDINNVFALFVRVLKNKPALFTKLEVTKNPASRTYLTNHFQLK